MPITRLPNSEYLTDDVMEEIFSNRSNPQEKQKKSDNLANPQKINEVAKLALEIDPLGKALTGRSPERIFIETSIPTEEMFPKDAKILYVGDPWQRMGRDLDKSHGKNLTIIDYEYGDVVAFISDDETFRNQLAFRTQQLLVNLSYLTRIAVLENFSDSDAQWLLEFSQIVALAHSGSEDTSSWDDYKMASESWKKAREYIETSYKKSLETTEQNSAEPGDPQIDPDDNLASFRASAWYDCVYAERGFRDIPDWHNIILPKIRDLETKLGDLSEDEKAKVIANFKRGWIEEIRLKNTTENVNVVEAVFPQLPFKDDSFDRLVASWSISAHLFAELDVEGFDTIWDETHRVLKTNGKAYIFPLNYYYFVDKTLIDSLENMKEKYPEMAYAILDAHGETMAYPLGGYEDNFTLVIKKGSLR